MEVGALAVIKLGGKVQWIAVTVQWNCLHVTTEDGYKITQLMEHKNAKMTALAEACERGSWVRGGVYGGSRTSSEAICLGSTGSHCEVGSQEGHRREQPFLESPVQAIAGTIKKGGVSALRLRGPRQVRDRFGSGRVGTPDLKPHEKSIVDLNAQALVLTGRDVRE